MIIGEIGILIIIIVIISFLHMSQITDSTLVHASAGMIASSLSTLALYPL